MEARTIDWDAIHRRLAATAAAISGERDGGPEATRRVLEARAKAAARVPDEADDAERLEVLAFSLAGETYAVETSYVAEVCPLGELAAVPCTPPFVAGIMGLHGRILAIIDLRRLFELPARGLTELNRVIVLGPGDDGVGLLADSIDGLRSVSVADLQEGLPTLSGSRERFLKGVTGEALAVLDGGRLLADAGLRVDEVATTGSR